MSRAAIIADSSTIPHAHKEQKEGFLMANTCLQISAGHEYSIHHEARRASRRRSFRDAYLTLLRKFEIESKEEYVFEFF